MKKIPANHPIFGMLVQHENFPATPLFCALLLIFQLYSLFLGYLPKVGNFQAMQPIFGIFAQSEKIFNQTPYFQDFFAPK